MSVKIPSFLCSLCVVECILLLGILFKVIFHKVGLVSETVSLQTEVFRPWWQMDLLSVKSVVAVDVVTSGSSQFILRKVSHFCINYS